MGSTSSKSYGTTKYITGLSRFDLYRLRREFKHYSEGKANDYEKRCEAAVSKVAAHMKIRLSAEQLRSAKLEMMQNSEKLLKEANSYARKSWKNHLAGGIGGAIVGGILFAISHFQFEMPAIVTVITTLFGAGVGYAMGKATPNDYPYMKKEKLVEVADTAYSIVSAKSWRH
jgi:hypothetical protein